MIYMYLLEQHLALLISIDNHLCDHAQGLHHNDFIQPRVRFHLHQLRVNISAFTTQQNTLHLNIRETSSRENQELMTSDSSYDN
jgi:hypothetical protein